ncbi:MAG: T9SS type A sorting domain-containing protein [bacterium]|nr:T9SS type A sorting domain-containing protein [Candidatus Kapabacteria bacterium]
MERGINLGGLFKSSAGLPNNIDARGTGPYPDCLPRATLVASPATLCPGECATIRIEDSRNLSEWSWTFAGGHPSVAIGGLEHNVCFDEPGVHRVSMTATNGRDTTTTTLDVFVSDQLVVDAGPSMLMCSDSIVALRAPSANRELVAFQWSPAELLSCADCASPIARVDSTTLFTVKVFDSYGCTAEDTVRVYVGNRTVVARVSNGLTFEIPDTSVVPVTIKGLFDGVSFSAVRIRLSLDSTVARFAIPDHSMLASMTRGTILDGWPLAIESVGDGHVNVLVTPPSPPEWRLVDTVLLNVPTFLLLTADPQTDIVCAVEFQDALCLDVINVNGKLTGNICGLSQRLIDSSSASSWYLTDHDAASSVLTGRSATASKLRVVVTSIRGESVWRYAGESESTNHELVIELNDLASGIYILSVFTDNDVWHRRFFHMH